MEHVKEKTHSEVKTSQTYVCLVCKKKLDSVGLAFMHQSGYHSGGQEIEDEAM